MADKKADKKVEAKAPAKEEKKEEPLAFSNERNPPSPSIPNNTVIKDSMSK